MGSGRAVEIGRRLFSRVRWSGFGRSRFGRLFAFLGPRQSRDSCRSRGLALLEKFVRSRHKPTWSRPPGKFAALPWCCRSVTPSGGDTRVPIHWSSRPTQPLLTAEPMHPPAHSPTAFGGRCRAAVPALSGANIGSGARSGAGFCAGLRLTPPRAAGAWFRIFRS